ncbi:MAG TPA: fibronectin type III domain-containing protein [Ktedonosporobacter sp.]|nr:fibronectin type III domain-containing protein [Ktedonosporobacter sp.]
MKSLQMLCCLLFFPCLLIMSLMGFSSAAYAASVQATHFVKPGGQFTRSDGGAPVFTGSTRVLAPRWVYLEWYWLPDATGVSVTRTPPGSQVFSSGFATSFTDQSAQPKTTYTYKVCAYYGAAPACSSIVITTPPLSPSSFGSPVDVTGYTATPSSFTVQWTSIHNYGVYLIRWAREGQPDTQIDDFQGHAYTINGLQPNTTYIFKVKGCDRSFWGTHSCPDDWAQVFIVTPKYTGPAGICLQGYVWREATPSDHVCVPPQTRSQAAYDNSQRFNRVSPNGGPYGPDTCLQGYVWREAFAGDHVCVTPQTRAQSAYDNSQAWSRAYH